MKEDKKSSKENEHPGLENGKKKGKEEKPATKVVIRRLPPSMTEEQFKEQVAPLPDNDYFYFVPADLTLGQNAFSRAYINFIDQNDLFIFTQKFDGYVFIDSKGGEFPAVVEFAPFQRIPKNRPNRKKDAKMGTIETDPCFIAFKERIEAEKLENKATITAPKQHFFETSSSEKKELTNTPLLDFIKNKKAERQRIRDEKLDEKRKKNLERRKLRKTKKEDETCVVKTSPAIPDQSQLKSKASGKVENSIIKNPNSHTKTNFEDSKKNKNCKEESQPLQLQVMNESNQVAEEKGGNKKVCDLVTFLNKSVKTNRKAVEDKTNLVFSHSKYVEHKDIEREIMKNAMINNKETSDRDVLTHPIIEKEMQVKYNEDLSNKHAQVCNSHNIPAPFKHFTESRSTALRNRIFVPCPVRDIVIKPQIVHFPHKSNENYSKSPSHQAANNNEAHDSSAKEILLIPPNKSGEEMLRSILLRKVNYDVGKKGKIESQVNVNEFNPETKKSFSQEAFRKNLQKVVEDVLGSSKVKSPKENVINKPKVFMKRASTEPVVNNSREGFNSPSFYLPPRAFGCGISEYKIIQEKDSSCQNKPYSNCPTNSLKTPALVQPNISKFAKFLPPFSKKSASCSKSDGYIEKSGDDFKVGGSEENIKHLTGTNLLDKKHQIMRRPNVLPKKSFFLNRNSKVIL